MLQCRYETSASTELLKRMPIHLASISRREFLKRSLAAGIAASLTPRLLAADKKVEPGSWALLSDIHIHADPSFKVRGINMTQHLTGACEQVLKLATRPAGVFINGDCAYNSGKPEDYRQVSRLLDPVRAAGIPIHMTVGNHDDRENFTGAFPDAKTAEAPEGRCVSLVKTDRANWLMLDSLEKTLATPGLLGAAQLKWLAQTLDANPGKPAIVMVHHNPGLEGGNMGLKDTLAFLEVIRPRTQVKAYVFGHTHTWRVEKDSSGLHLVNLPAVSYVFKEGEPSGWVHASVSESGMSLELNCTDPAHPANGQTMRLNWRS